MASGSGLLVSVAQAVVKSGSGLLVSLAQVVDLRISGKGRLVDVAQDVQVTGSGSLLALRQRVRDVAAVRQYIGEAGYPFFSGAFDLTIIVGNVDVTPSIVETVSITREENSSALADFTFRAPAGVQDLTRWHGKTVTITHESESGTRLMYTGVVDIPIIDLIEKTITLKCTDSREARNEAQPAEFVQSIGYWSKDVFGEPETLADELEQRLETVPYALDYDSYGSRTYTAWQPKTVADFSLGDHMIYYRRPSVEVLSRGRVTNQITLNLEYQYQRLRQRTRNYSFDSELSACTYFAHGLPPTNVQLQQAIDAAGWEYTAYSSDGLDPSGRYICQGGVIYWSTTRNYAETAPKLDENGDQVTDANGNPVYTQTGRSTSDIQNVYAQSATWTATKRWAQNVSEKLTVTLTAPQSISQYGLTSTTESYGHRDEYDATKWEQMEGYQPAPSDFLTSANGDKYRDQNADVAGWQNMALCAIARAKTRIQKAHRDNRVTFETPLWAGIELRHTVETTGGTVRAKGKVYRITHTFDVSNRESATEVELALSQAAGSAVDSPVVVPTRPAVTDPATNVQTINLRTHTIPQGGEASDNWAGYIFQDLGSGFKRQVAMVVDTPAIDDQSRDTKTAERSQVYTVEIRNDMLEVEF